MVIKNVAIVNIIDEQIDSKKSMEDKNNQTRQVVAN